MWVYFYFLFLLFYAMCVLLVSGWLGAQCQWVGVGQGVWTRDLRCSSWNETCDSKVYKCNLSQNNFCAVTKSSDFDVMLMVTPGPVSGRSHWKFELSVQLVQVDIWALRKAHPPLCSFPKVCFLKLLQGCQSVALSRPFSLDCESSDWVRHL